MLALNSYCIMCIKCIKYIIRAYNRLASSLCVHALCYFCFLMPLSRGEEYYAPQLRHLSENNVAHLRSFFNKKKKRGLVTKTDLVLHHLLRTSTLRGQCYTALLLRGARRNFFRGGQATCPSSTG